MTRVLQAYQLFLAGLGVYFASSFTRVPCGPTYFLRPDVLMIVSILICAAGLLVWGALGESNTRLVIGLLGAASLASVLLRINVAAGGLALLGALRLPADQRHRARHLAAVALAVLVTQALPSLAQAGMRSEQFICP